jgi:hypothetical protein
MEIALFHSRVFASYKLNEGQGISPTDEKVLDRLPARNKLLSS